jgi:hypothetical protein
MTCSLETDVSEGRSFLPASPGFLLGLLLDGEGFDNLTNHQLLHGLTWLHVNESGG